MASVRAGPCSQLAAAREWPGAHPETGNGGYTSLHTLVHLVYSATKQWFDTAYPAGGGANRPTITGPGLAGAGFYAADGTCA
jgi:hypothetical protein